MGAAILRRQSRIPLDSSLLYDFSRINLFDRSEFQGFVGATVGTSSSAVSTLLVEGKIRSAVLITQGSTADQANPPGFANIMSFAAGTVLFLSFYYQVQSGTAGMQATLSVVSGGTTYYLSSDGLSWGTAVTETIFIGSVSSTNITRVLFRLPPLPAAITSLTFSGLYRTVANYSIKLSAVQLALSDTAYEPQLLGQTLVDDTPNLYTVAQATLGADNAAGASAPTYDAASKVFTFPATGASLLLGASIPNVGAGGTVTFMIRARGSGAFNIYVTDNITGSGSAGQVSITLTSSFQDFFIISTFAAAQSATMVPVILRTGGVSTLEVSTIMVTYGTHRQYYRTRLDGQLGSTSANADTTDPTWTPTGIAFDGTDDFIQIPNAPASSSSETFSFMIPPAPSSGEATIYNQRPQSSSVGFFYIYRDSDGIRYQWSTGSAFAISTALFVPSEIVVGDLCTIVAEYGAVMKFTAYRNGVFVRTTTAATAGLAVTSATGYIGRYNAASGPLSGTQFHFSRYGRALQAREVQALYRSVKRSLFARGVVVP